MCFTYINLIQLVGAIIISILQMRKLRQREEM